LALSQSYAAKFDLDGKFFVLNTEEVRRATKGHEEEKMLVAERLSERVIGLAITVHRHTGPGLLESVYEPCLCHELAGAGVPFERQAVVPVLYRGIAVGDGFKADIVVDGQIILEIKAVACILPAHQAQLHTYLRMSGIRVGLLFNFNARRLVDGLYRHVL